MKITGGIIRYLALLAAFSLILACGAWAQDNSSTQTFYGDAIPYKTLLTGGRPAPQEAKTFLTAISKYAGGQGMAAAK